MHSGTAKERSRLPVEDFLPQIYSKLLEKRVLIVVGETGSGKTTQIPKYLHKMQLSKDGAIAITQPRRIAAISISNRVSKELGTRLVGLCPYIITKVGYAVRFEDFTSKKTKLKYMTDGILLKELSSSPDLGSYSCIIIDEAHERTCRTDILLGVAKGLLKTRSDFKLIIMSATIDAEKFSLYLDQAEIIEIPGRQYPVSTLYPISPLDDYFDGALVTIFQIHVEEKEGDILVFLVGQDEIENMKIIIEENARTLPPSYLKLFVVTVYASMPLEEQAKVFERTPEGSRKVILSTNISETSITIPRIKYVIDTGVAKIRSFDHKSGLEILSVRPISKLSAKQRSGRAGRESSGFCYRLYTYEAFKKLPNSTLPEILRTNINDVVLALKSLGISNILEFKFIDPPPRSAERLYSLGGLDDMGSLTDLGKKMAILPVPPEFTKVIVTSSSKNCLDEAISIISMLSVERVFWAPNGKSEEAAVAKRNFYSQYGDHMVLLNLFKAYMDVNQDSKWCAKNFISATNMKKVMCIKNQLLEYCKKLGIKNSSSDATPTPREILTSFLSGFFDKIAWRQSFGVYSAFTTRQIVNLHPSSSLFNQKPEIVMYNEVISTTKHYMRNCSRISPEWIVEALPSAYKTKNIASLLPQN